MKKKKKLRIRKVAPPPPPPPPPKRPMTIIPYTEKTWCGCVIEGERHGVTKRDLRVISQCPLHAPKPPKIRVKKLKIKKKLKRK